MSSSFNPYSEWFHIPEVDQPPNHYELLGIEEFEPDQDAIRQAIESRVDFLQDVSQGKLAPHAQKILNEVARAKVCLTNVAKKKKYDQDLFENRRSPGSEKVAERQSPPAVPKQLPRQKPPTPPTRTQAAATTSRTKPTQSRSVSKAQPLARKPKSAAIAQRKKKQGKIPAWIPSVIFTLVTLSIAGLIILQMGKEGRKEKREKKATQAAIAQDDGKDAINAAFTNEGKEDRKKRVGKLTSREKSPEKSSQKKSSKDATNNKKNRENDTETNAGKKPSETVDAGNKAIDAKIEQGEQQVVVVKSAVADFENIVEKKGPRNQSVDAPQFFETGMGKFHVGEKIGIFTNDGRNPDEQHLHLRGGEGVAVVIEIADDVPVPGELNMNVERRNENDAAVTDDQFLTVEVSTNLKEWKVVSRNESSDAIALMGDTYPVTNDISYSIIDEGTRYLRITCNSADNSGKPTESGMLIGRMSITPLKKGSE